MAVPLKFSANTSLNLEALVPISAVESVVPIAPVTCIFPVSLILKI